MRREDRPKPRSEKANIEHPTPNIQHRSKAKNLTGRSRGSREPEGILTEGNRGNEDREDMVAKGLGIVTNAKSTERRKGQSRILHRV
jgi:hypothetical protein